MPFKSLQSRFPLTCLAVVLLIAGSLRASAGDVLVYHNDLQSTGQNLAETTLTPTSIQSTAFRKRFSTLVDGQVYAQPLYKAGVEITAGAHRGTHNVAFIATEHDSLYAIDAENGEVLWHDSFLKSGLAGATLITSVTAKNTDTTDLSPQIGITGTPVIDPGTSSIYVAAKTREFVAGGAAAHFVHSLYKIDLGNGSVAAKRIVAATTVTAGQNYQFRTKADPAVDQDPFVLGTGDGAITVNGQSRVYFNGLRQAIRAGLVLHDGTLFLTSASHGDVGPYHGWVLAFDAITLQPTGVFNTTPNGGLGGLWQAGGIPTFDSDGYLYIATGNGTFDGDVDDLGNTIGLDGNGFPANQDYGDCILKLTIDDATNASNQNANGWGLKVIDYFSPMNTQSLAEEDLDFGSGGVVILPDSVGSSGVPHLLVGAGKDGNIYLLDRSNLGKFDPNTNHVVQTLGNAIGGSFGTPAFFNGRIHWAGQGDNGKTFPISSAAFSPNPDSTTLDSFGFPGATPSISANGSLNGIAWTIESSTSELRAYDADDFSNQLWTSNDAPKHRDQLGKAVKFSVPTVADGRVFVGTADSLVAYGPPALPAAPPGAPSKLAATALPGLQAHLEWQAGPGETDGFSVEESADGVDFQPVTTTGSTHRAVTVAGLQPLTLYSFRVRAFNQFQTLSYSDYSNVATAASGYQPPAIDFSSGFATAASALTVVGSATFTNSNTVELTDGNESEAGAVWSQQPHDITHFSTEFSFRLTEAIADGFTFCLQNAGATALGGTGADLGYGGIGSSVAVKFDFYPNRNSTGVYKGGSQPVEDSHAVEMAGAGILLHSGDIFDVALVYNGTALTETVLDTQTNAVFTKQYAINLAKAVGANTAYVGFTGGTGGATSIQEVLTWSYAPTPAHPPAAPAQLAATAASGTEVDLSWADQDNGQAGFIVSRRAGASGGFVKIAAQGPAQTTYADTGLSPGMSYYYRVVSSNGEGLSGFATAHAKTPMTPSAPEKLTALANEHGIDLEWPAAKGAGGYHVLRREGGHYRVIATLEAGETRYRDTSISPTTLYDYAIEAYSGGGVSGKAEVLSVEAK